MNESKMSNRSPDILFPVTPQNSFPFIKLLNNCEWLLNKRLEDWKIILYWAKKAIKIEWFYNTIV